MPKRVIDYEAMWASEKLSRCAPWAQAEYAWLYGLADACGSFELTNLRVIWGRVAAIRQSLSLERLEQIFDEFHAQGLLFIWEESGKRYAHWTASDRPGRLPRPSWRERLERFAPDVPQRELAAYMNGFAHRNLTPRREAPHAQYENKNGNENENGYGNRNDAGYPISQEQSSSSGEEDSEGRRPRFLSEEGRSRGLAQVTQDAGRGEGACALAAEEVSAQQARDNTLEERTAAAAGHEAPPRHFAATFPGAAPRSSAQASARGEPDAACATPHEHSKSAPARTVSRTDAPACREHDEPAAGTVQRYAPLTAREEAVRRELIAGRGPTGPVRVRPEYWEKLRLRDEEHRRRDAERRKLDEERRLHAIREKWGA